MNNLLNIEKVKTLSTRLVNESKNIHSRLTEFYRQAKRYARDNIKNCISCSVLKKFCFQILLFFFSCWIYNDFESVFRKIIVKYANDILILISKIIEENLSVNVFILLAIGIVCYEACCKIWKNFYYSVCQLLIGCFLLFVLSFDEFWDYNKLPFIDFCYDDLFRFIICIVLVSDILKVIVHVYKKIIKYNSGKGLVYFTNDKIEDIGENAIRKLYARSIINQLLNTNTTNESFSLAVTGEWGSGKSTFLKCMKDEINQSAHAYVMEFNPWNSMSPQTVIEDYFQQLNNFVSPLYTPLEKSLLSYVHALTKININQNINQLLNLLLPNPKESLCKLKENVEKGLKHIDKPIIVIIDDIDRLEKEELFEVLKLIRNTGCFTNLLYIVAYDEKYVTQQLKHKGIYDGKLFLEKIFVTQVALPKADLTEVFITFKMQVRSMVKRSSWVNSCFDRLKTNEIKNIKRALYSYRRTKHFARQLSASAIFLYDNLGPKYFSLHDLLFIELLRFLSPSLYEILTYNPSVFLKSIRKEGSKNHSFRYVIEANAKDKLKNFLKEQKCDMQDVIFDIFELLFEDEGDIPKSSIRWTDKYVNYMCLGIPQNKVSDLEFSTMINASTEEGINGGMCAIIRGWCLSGICKKDFKSIYDHFVSHKLNRKSEKEAFQYIYALFYWFEFNKYKRDEYDKLIVEKVSKYMHKNNHNENFYNQLRNIVIDRFNNLLEKKEYEKIAKLCANIYIPAKNNELLISKDDVINIMKENIINLLQSKKWDPINLITNDGNKLNLVFELACVSYTTKSGHKIYENPLAREVVNWMASNARRSKHIDKFESLFDTILSENEILGVRNNVQKQNMEYFFGSDFSDIDLLNFRTNCFVFK